VRSRSNKTGAGPADDSGSAEPSTEAGLASRAPTDLDGREDTADPQPSGQASSRSASSGSRRALKNWRVRSRLVLLIAIPTLTAVVLGGTSILSYARAATADGRIQQLATLSSHVTVLAERLEDERDQTVYYVGLGTQGGRAEALAALAAHQSVAASGAAPELQVVQQQYVLTNQAVRVVSSELSQINGSFSAQAQAQAATARTALVDLPFLRTASTLTALPALVVVQKYTQLLDNLLPLIDVTGQGASDATLGQAIRVLGLVSRMKEEASQQRGILTVGLLQQRLDANELNTLTSAESDQQSNLQSFNTSASAAQRQLWNNSVASSFVFQANGEESQAIAIAQTKNGSLATDLTGADSWFGAMSNEVDAQMGTVEHALSGQITARAATLHRDALTAALVVGLVVLLVLGLALILTVVVGRSMVRPLRRLRAGALEVAGVRLPDMVRRMSETDGTGISFDVAPIDVDSSDEIGEVARAFDQVHREALRLAANEAALRGNVNAMFVNLSRRSQSLVERQIRLIDDLEQGEQDPERLANLFQMDHLATRMRRNSENLLVLAGHEVSRRWNQPVALVDVLRAAVSEIEQYERVSMNVQPGISVRGQAVNDVVHLVAELVENATSFSSAETPVTVSGHLLNSGGVLLDISDQGVGMGAEEMAHANWRLDNPPVVDVAVSRRMGLFVVARLAARHGIRVRLRPAPTGGLAALVWLPDETVTHEGVGPAMPGGRRLGSNGSSTPESVEPLATGSEWGPRQGRTAAEEAVNAARAPRFAPLHAENGDSAATAGFPAISPSSSWEDTATKAPGPSWGDWPGPAPAAPAWDGAAAKPDAASWDDAPAQPAPPSWDTPPAKPDGPSWDDAPAQPAAASWEERPSAPDSAPPPAASTGPLPSVSSTGSMPAFGAPLTGGDAGQPPRLPTRQVRASFSNETGPIRREVVVPPAAPMGQGNRLPIFESVESDWFRRGRHSADRPNGNGNGNGNANASAGVSASASAAPEESSASWTSASDDGWRAAEAVSKPASGGVTLSGLPKRIPKANLVPGTVSGNAAAAPPPTRSAAITRDRFASFQRGIRDARAAVNSPDDDGGEGDGGT
jgi:signal transduction histidine kinase